MSVFSTAGAGPDTADLSGVLCGPGQVATRGSESARLSIVVGQEWRAAALAEEFRCRGVTAEVAAAGSSDDGRRLVRTGFHTELRDLARQFSRGAMKALPPGFRLDGGTLRLWALACGGASDRGFVFPLDRRAPDTHRPLLAALTHTGLSGSIVGPRAGGPALRVTGKRRLTALAQLLGPPPEGGENAWSVTYVNTPVG